MLFRSVALNGVTNSPTHQPWQVLVNYQGYGQTDFNQKLAEFRAVIDTVQLPAPPPQVSAPHTVGADFEFTLAMQTGRTYRVEISTNLVNWTTLRSVTGSATPILFRDTNAPPTLRFYRAAAQGVKPHPAEPGRSGRITPRPASARVC